MTNEVYLDTAFAIALSSATDRYHEQAMGLARKLKSDGTSIVTARPVLLEIGNALSSLRFRQAAIKLLNALEEDPAVTIVSLTDELYLRAFDLFAKRPDKDWGIIDCLSFVVMADRGITKALTSDYDFIQAGFGALLLGGES